MVSEMRQICASSADAMIKDVDWRKCDKNLLFNKYVEVESVNKALAGAYISAILVRYWYTIGHNVLRGSGKCSEEECYNWLVDALMYTLEHKAWLDPSKTVYGDKNGPDKCLNIKLECTRKVFYLYSNSQKRKKDFSDNISLEGLIEVCGDCELASDEHLDIDAKVNPLVSELVVDEFIHKNYMASFIIDGVVNGDVFDVSQDEKGVYSQFNKRKLNRYLNSIDVSYSDIFAKKYKLPRQDVEDAILTCKTLSRARIQSIIANTFSKLSLDERLLEKD